MLTNDIRPKKFSEVKGQEYPVKLLKKVVQNPDKAPRIYLLHGPHGTGKTKRIAVITSISQAEAKEAKADIIGGEEMIDKIAKKIDFAKKAPINLPKFVNNIFGRILKFENYAISKDFSLPTGLTLYGICCPKQN